VRIVLATGNPDKVAELREMFPGVDVGAAHDGFDVEETGVTLLQNAWIKAAALRGEIAEDAWVVADDSGWVVHALGGRPGVFSARYAGPDAADEENNRKLINELRNVPDSARTARFRSCLALADVAGRLGDAVIVAQGVCEGSILRQPRGTGGFGYDPLFYSPELNATFAELGIGTKNDLSHRARAMAAMTPRLIAYFRLAKPAHSE